MADAPHPYILRRSGFDRVVYNYEGLAVLIDPAALAAHWTPEQWRVALEAGEKAGRVTGGTLSASDETGQKARWRVWRLMEDEP